MKLRFTWDEAKAASNRRKHYVSFETAARVFTDLYALSEQDRVEGGEYRWQTIGSVEGVVVLLVAHTMRDAENGGDVIHIISARRAERSERRRYEEEKYRQLRT
jgi:uncharacterized DUF497 family protein